MPYSIMPNSLLYALTERAIHAAGLDAWMGLLHKSRPGRPTLVYDCIEPFRPWVNEWLCEALHQNLLQPGWVQAREQTGCSPAMDYQQRGAGSYHHWFQPLFFAKANLAGQKAKPAGSCICLVQCAGKKHGGNCYRWRSSYSGLIGKS